MIIPPAAAACQILKIDSLFLARFLVIKNNKNILIKNKSFLIAKILKSATKIDRAPIKRKSNFDGLPLGALEGCWHDNELAA